MSTTHSRSTSVGRHVTLAVEHRHRLGERAGALQPPDVGDGGVGCQELGELRDAPVVDEGLLVRAVLPRRARQAALVADDERQAGDEERGLAGAGDQLVVVERGVLEEDLPVGPVADARAGDPPLRLADDRQLAAPLVGRELVLGVLLVARDVGEVAGLAPAEAHGVRLAAPVDLDVEAGRERVDDRSPDAVQPTGGGVGAATELAAGVQLGEDHLDARQPGARLDVDRDAARVVGHLDRAVPVQDDVDALTMAGERLVDGVVDDLPEAVHEAPAVGRPDVHARTLAHRLEPLEDLQVVRAVVRRRLGRRGLLGSGGCSHGLPFSTRRPARSPDGPSRLSRAPRAPGAGTRHTRLVVLSAGLARAHPSTGRPTYESPDTT